MAIKYLIRSPDLRLDFSQDLQDWRFKEMKKPEKPVLHLMCPKPVKLAVSRFKQWRGFLVAQRAKNPPSSLLETELQSLGLRWSPGEGKATHFSILYLRISLDKEAWPFDPWGYKSQLWLSNWTTISSKNVGFFSGTPPGSQWLVSMLIVRNTELWSQTGN